MSRILHVSHFSWKKGVFLHGVPHKISNGLIRNGHQVINFCARDTARSASLFGSRKLGRRHANEMLLELCRQMEPEGIVFGHAEVIKASTLLEIRRMLPHVRIVHWNVDPLFDDSNIRQIEAVLDVVDATLITTGGDHLRRFVRNRHKVGFLPNPTDASIETGAAYEAQDLAFDLLYVVTNPKHVRHYCGRMWNVEELGRLIQSRLPEVSHGFFGMLGREKLVGGAFQRALESSKMGLNVSKRNDYYLYSSDRMAQMFGNGLLVFLDRATHLTDLIAEDMAAFHSDIEELIDKIRFFHRNDASRREVARRGAEHYRAAFNEQIVARYITDVMFDRLDRSAYPWPTLVS